MGIIDAIGSVFGLGGGGGSATSFSSTTTLNGGLISTLAGGFTSTLQGGASPIAIDVGGTNDPVKSDVTLHPVTAHVGGTDTPVGSDVTLRPVTTTSHVGGTETPLQSEVLLHPISSSVDVAPLEVDVCLDVGISRLPRSKIRQPYQGRVGVVVLGTELFGLDWSGEADVLIDDLEQGPTIVDGGHVRGSPAPSRARPRVIGDGQPLTIRIGA